MINIVKKRKVEILSHSDQRLFIYKNSLLGFKKTDHLIKKWGVELNRELLKDETQKNKTSFLRLFNICSHQGDAN